MRCFLIATAATVALGVGSLTLFADSGTAAPPAHAALELPAQKALALAPASESTSVEVKAVESGSFVSRDLAFDRLTLEARLEEFYARLAAEAEGKSEAERVALYHEAEAELTRLILGSSSYSGSNIEMGHDYLALARLALAQRLGLDAVPA